MKGTEKQIVWATEIRTNVIKSLEFIKANARPQPQPGTRTRIDDMIELLNEDDVYAGDIIDIFKHIRFGEDEVKNGLEVIATYRVTVPHTAGAKRILNNEGR